MVAIDSIEDLTDLGLDKLRAKILLRFSSVWKKEGLPADFKLTILSASTPSPFTEVDSAEVSVRRPRT